MQDSLFKFLQSALAKTKKNQKQDLNYCKSSHMSPLPLGIAVQSHYGTALAQIVSHRQLLYNWLQYFYQLRLSGMTYSLQFLLNNLHCFYICECMCMYRQSDSCRSAVLVVFKNSGQRTAGLGMTGREQVKPSLMSVFSFLLFF